MSKLIGTIGHHGSPNAFVHASRGGVELHSDSRFVLEPNVARGYAAALKAAADEVEIMRKAVPDVEPPLTNEEWHKLRDAINGEIRDDSQRTLLHRIINAHVRGGTWGSLPAPATPLPSPPAKLVATCTRCGEMALGTTDQTKKTS